MYSGDLNPSYRHGHTSGKFSPTYHSWACMIQRCTKPQTTADRIALCRAMNKGK